VVSHPPGAAAASRFQIGRSAALLLVPLLLAAAAGLFALGASETWSVPSILDPLGTDEFGRDLLATAIVATGLSFAKGAALTMLVLCVGLLIAEGMTLARSEAASVAVTVVARILESVPTVLWVVVIVVLLKEQRVIVAAVAFVTIVAPSAATLMAGELQRLRRLPFIESAYLMGVSEGRILLRHVLPHAGPILLPFAIQVLGGAIAIDGAIGVLGLGSRSDLDLGVFLVRGKENFPLHPQVLWIGILMYGAVYAYLFALARVTGDRAATPEFDSG
jgi:ABC-type dipeptide/oligopeptide/nickel transport system permease subunit